MYVRYKQVEALSADGGAAVRRLNYTGLLLGLLSSLGMCVVANFQVRAGGAGAGGRKLSANATPPSSKQKTTLFSVHLVGAALTLGVGAFYVLVQTLLSFRMQPHIHSRGVFLARLAIGVWTLCSIASSILPTDAGGCL